MDSACFGQAPPHTNALLVIPTLTNGLPNLVRDTDLDVDNHSPDRDGGPYPGNGS